MTKPVKIGAGIGVAGLCCLVPAAAGGGIARVLWTWTALSCFAACAAYLRNRPGWLGKRDGARTLRALPLLPYLVAFRIACALMRWWRGGDAPTLVAPGLWVGGRIDTRTLPRGVQVVVDLVAEYPEPRALRTRAGYRGFPLLDGGFPPDAPAFVALIAELAAVDGDILVHCDSGRGRAPTVAAALLIAQGKADDPAGAVARIRAQRPVSAPTRSDLAFLARILPALRRLAEPRPAATALRHEAR